MSVVLFIDSLADFIKLSISQSVWGLPLDINKLYKTSTYIRLTKTKKQKRKQ